MTEENKRQTVLNGEQTALVTELTETYGIEPEDIIFFQGDKKPFLSYEATCALCNILTNLAEIGVEPVASPMADAVAVKCTILTAQGRERSAVGVANLNEKLNDAQVSSQQAVNLASSRALRNTLRAAGIDLLKIHKEAMTGEVPDFKIKSNYNSLIAEAHVLGSYKNLISGANKSLWYHELWSRYRVSKSSELSEEQLADFVAYLKSYEPPQVKAAA